MPWKLRRHEVALLASAFGIAIALSAGKAEAQTTTCMAMGPDMMTCNSMPPATIPNGGGPSASPVDIYRMIFGDKVRKNIGRMLASGDCEGAARYAYEKGRLELGNDIAQTCRPSIRPYTPANRTATYNGSPAQAERGVEALYQTIGFLARSAPVPFMVDAPAGSFAVTKIDALNTQLRLDVEVDDSQLTLAEVASPANLQVICDDPSFSEVLRLGGSIRLTFFHKGGTLLGAATETGRLCGF